MRCEVDCPCCQVPSANGIQRDRDRINDVSSNMKTSESLLSASASQVASERWRCHSDRRVRQCKWENDCESGAVASATCTRLSASWPTSGLLRSVPRKISLLEPQVSFSNSDGRDCTMVWQKIRSVSHFLQPPPIDKASEVKRKNECISKA